jgi:hypothetical protein
LNTLLLLVVAVVAQVQLVLMQGLVVVQAVIATLWVAN